MNATHGSHEKRRRQIDRLKSHQVRLVISVPALMFLSALLMTLVIQAQLGSVAEKLPSGPVRQEAEHLADLVLWVGLVGSAAMGFTGILLAGSIVRPVRRLMKTMEEVAAGDLTQKAEVNELGEIGLLGSSFNQMVDHLHDLFEQRDRQMRESAAGTIITLDGRARVLAADSAVKHVLGVDPENLLRRDIVDRLKEACGDENRHFIESLTYGIDEALQGRTGVGTVEFIHPESGESFFYSLHFSLLESADENSPTLLLDIRDLTGMRAFHEQMQRADRLAALGTLATGIAHEIRNPLASMKAMTQLLSEDLAQSQQSSMSKEYLPRVVAEIDRLDRLVRGIMEFASTERGPVTPVDLNQLAREAFDAARHRIEPEIMNRIEVNWKLDEALPECPLEDQRLHQALLNMVSNALESLAERGGGVLRIESCLDPNHQRPIVLRIMNTTEPIAQAVRTRLFEPFFTTKPQGSGLGLPIAYQIIVANCGMVDVDYKDGMIQFAIRFPLEGRRARAGRVAEVTS